VGGEQRRARALAAVRGHVAAVLGHETATVIPADAAFKDLGFDSLAAVELRNRLAAAAALRLPATLVFDHPSSRALATYLLERLDAEEERAQARDEASLEDEVVDLETRIGRADPAQRERIAARLRHLLATLVAPAPHEAELSEASEDELFALLDRELGEG
jgi:polyketide synthase 12